MKKSKKHRLALIFQNALTAYRQVSKHRRSDYSLNLTKALAHQDERGEALNQSQVHILVVDDERNIRNHLGMVLEAKGSRYGQHRR
jgi:PleD family two-component response regulator